MGFKHMLNLNHTLEYFLNWAFYEGMSPWELV